VEDNVAVKPPHYLWLKVAPLKMAQAGEKLKKKARARLSLFSLCKTKPLH
jgi:hypothetical protein